MAESTNVGAISLKLEVDSGGVAAQIKSASSGAAKYMEKFNASVERQKNRIAALESEYERLNQKIVAYTRKNFGKESGGEDKAFHRMAEQADRAMAKIEAAQKELELRQKEAAEKAAREAQRAQEKTAEAARKSAAAQQGAAEKASQAQEKAAVRAVKSAQQAAAKAKSSMGGLLGFAAKGFSRLGKIISGAFKAVFISSALYGAFRSLGELLGNAAQQSNAFSSALARLKSNLAAAFQPIISTALPMLTSLIDKLAQAAAAAAGFLSQLFGKTFAQSKQAAAAVKSTAAAVQKTAGQTASFDEHVVISKEEGLGNTGDADASTAGDLAAAQAGETFADKLLTALDRAKQKLAELSQYFMERLGGGEAFSTLQESWSRFVGDMQTTAANLGYIGGVIGGAIAESFQKNLPSIEAGISGFVQTAANLTGIAMETAGGLARGISGGVASFVSEREEEIRGFIERTVANFSAGFENLGQGFAAISGSVLGAVRAFWEENSLYAETFFSSFANAVYSVVQPVTDFLSGVWLDLTEALRQLAEDPGIENFFAAINDLLAAAQPLWEALCYAINQEFNKAAGILNVVLGGIRIALETIAQVIKNVFLMHLDALTTGLKGLAELLKGNVSGAFKVMQDNACKSLDNLKARWRDTWEGIVRTASDMINRVVESVSSAVNRIKDALGSIGSKISGAVGSAKSWVTGRIESAGLIRSPETPQMASGGVLTQPTLAMVGEYAGATGNPEIVAPQSIMAETFLGSIMPLISMLEDKLDVIAQLLEILTQANDGGGSGGTSGDALAQLARILAPYLKGEGDRTGGILFDRR